MDTVNILRFGLRIFFFLTTFMALRYGALTGVALSLIAFLLMEYFVEDLEETTKVEYIRKTPYIE